MFSSALKELEAPYEGLFIGWRNVLFPCFWHLPLSLWKSEELFSRICLLPRWSFSVPSKTVALSNTQNQQCSSYQVVGNVATNFRNRLHIFTLRNAKVTRVLRGVVLANSRQLFLHLVNGLLICKFFFHILELDEYEKQNILLLPKFAILLPYGECYKSKLAIYDCNVVQGS